MGSDPSSREGMPLKGAPTVVCARTSLAVPLVDDARNQQRCVGATASRDIVWRARWLAAHERREGLALSRTA